MYDKTTSTMTIMQLYRDCNQYVKLFHSKETNTRAKLTSRFLYNICELLKLLNKPEEVVDSKALPKDPLLLNRLAIYSKFFTSIEYQNNGADEQILIEIGVQLKQFFETSETDYLNNFKEFGKKIQNLTKTPLLVINDSQKPELIRTSHGALDGKPGYMYDILSQLKNKGYLAEDMNYEMTSTLDNERVLNFIQLYLQEDFNDSILNQLLDQSYSSRGYTQRNTIRDNPATLYVYLKFAITGPIQAISTSTAIVVKNADSFQISETATPMLNAVLKGKIKPKVLIKALIGGAKVNDFFYSEQEDLVAKWYPPLIFFFLENQEQTQLIVKKICNMEDIVADSKKEIKQELLQLVDFLINHHTQNNVSLTKQFVETLMKRFFETLIKELENSSLGKDEAFKKEIIDKYKSILIDTVRLPTCQEKTLLITLPDQKSPDSDPENEVTDEKQKLANEIQSYSSELEEKLADDSSLGAMELHQHKIAVLNKATLLLTQGAQNNLDEYTQAKKQYFRYPEGIFSKTKSLVERTDSLISTTQKNAINNQSQNQEQDIALIIRAILDFCNAPGNSKVDGLVKMKAIIASETTDQEKFKQLVALAEWKKSDNDLTFFVHKIARNRAPEVEAFYRKLATLTLTKNDIDSFAGQYSLNHEPTNSFDII